MSQAQAKPAKRLPRNISERGGSYHVKVRMKGHTITGTRATVGEAKALRDEVKTQLRQGTHPKQLEAAGIVVKTVEQLFTDYRSAYLTGDKPWHMDFRRYLKIWEKHFGSTTPVQAVTANMIVQGIAKLRSGKLAGGKPMKESSARTYCAPLRRALNLAHEWGWLERVPKVTWPAKAPEHNFWLNKEQREDLFEACKAEDPTGRLHDVVLLGFATGFRKAELLDIRVKDVDFEHGERGAITVLGKGAKQRTIPILAECRDMLRRRVEGKGPEEYLWDSRNIHHKQWVRIRNYAGIEKMTIHWTRHTFATELIRNGVTLKVVSKLLGHSSIRETMRYIHVEDAQFLAESAIKLEGVI